MIQRVTLLWPYRPLWPNARPHWAVLRRWRDRQVYDTRVLLMEAGWSALSGAPAQVQMGLTFRAPTRRSYDLDNALAACKAALDEIARTLGVDDRLFQPILTRGEPIKGGAVEVMARPVWVCREGTGRWAPNDYTDLRNATIARAGGGEE